jgi:hypothetical protein
MLSPDEVDGAGRLVRCEACGTAWLARHFGDETFGRRESHPRPAVRRQEPLIIEGEVVARRSAPAERPAPPRAVPPVEREAPSRPAAPPRAEVPQPGYRAPTNRRLAMVGATLCAGVALALAVPILTSLPGVAGLFADRGLSFRDISSSTMRRGVSDTIIVSAEIVNDGRRAADLPPVRITLTNDDGRAVYSWVVVPSVHSLGAGRSVQFRSALADPVPGARHAVLAFAGPEPQVVGMR